MGAAGGRVPAEPGKHILRRLQAVLDLNFVREEVAALYGKRGNISVDPA